MSCGAIKVLHIGSGDGVLLDGTKPLPESKMGYGGAIVLARLPTGNYSTAMTLEHQV